MSYTIKTYTEGFENDQAKIGKEVTASWTGYTMSSAEAIKNSYSQEGFDPETRLYAFKDDKMVGFLTGYMAEDAKGIKEAHYRFPILLPENEDAAKPLIERSLEVFKEKGAEKIITGFEDDWGKNKEYAEKFGFTYERDGNKYSLTSVDELTIPTISSDYSIQELDLEKHEEPLVAIFRDAFGMEQEAAQNNFNLIKSFDQSLVVTHSAVFEGDKIIARALLYKPNAETTDAYLGNIYTPKDQEREFYDLFMNHIVQKAKEANVKRINKPLFGANPDPSLYETYGFKFDRISKNYRYDYQ